MEPLTTTDKILIVRAYLAGELKPQQLTAPTAITVLQLERGMLFIAETTAKILYNDFEFYKRQFMQRHKVKQLTVRWIKHSEMIEITELINKKNTNHHVK